MDQDNIDNLCRPTARRRRRRKMKSHNLGLVTAVYQYQVTSVETSLSDPNDEKDHKCDRNKIKTGKGGEKPEREES